MNLNWASIFRHLTTPAAVVGLLALSVASVSLPAIIYLPTDMKVWAVAGAFLLLALIIVPVMLILLLKPMSLVMSSRDLIDLTDRMGRRDQPLTYEEYMRRKSTGWPPENRGSR
ncbi:MAG: hypothetical protein WD848_04295 [Dehalococcoidia bacterium]